MSAGPSLPNCASPLPNCASPLATWIRPPNWDGGSPGSRIRRPIRPACRIPVDSAPLDDACAGVYAEGVCVGVAWK